LNGSIVFHYQKNISLDLLLLSHGVWTPLYRIEDSFDKIMCNINIAMRLKKKLSELTVPQKVVAAGGQ
jgi:hypothetical protein